MSPPPEEAQKRYSDTIEAAIGKAMTSREPVAIEAQDGAKVYAYPKPRGDMA